jgi:hypothetical protein
MKKIAQRFEVLELAAHLALTAQAFGTVEHQVFDQFLGDSRDALAI